MTKFIIFTAGILLSSFAGATDINCKLYDSTSRDGLKLDIACSNFDLSDAKCASTATLGNKSLSLVVTRTPSLSNDFYQLNIDKNGSKVLVDVEVEMGLTATYYQGTEILTILCKTK